MIMTNEIPLITDEKNDLLKDLRALHKQIFSMKQVIHKLFEEYNLKKRRYEEIDKSRALKDGRLKVVKAKPREKSYSKKDIESILGELSQEEIDRLIEELSK